MREQPCSSRAMVKSVRAAGLRGPVMVPVRRTHAILPGPTPCNARAPQTDAPSCSWILRRRGVLNPVERQREIRLSRAQHWCSAAEQRHRLLHAAAGSLASCTSSSVPGGGAQSLWRRGCVQRLSQQSSEQRRNLQLLSRLRGLLGGAMDVLDCTVAYSGKRCRVADRGVLSACAAHCDVYCVLVRYRV